MFSVVIPLYNKENYIRRAVDSVLNQDFKNFELIVVNDGSTDQSLAKLDDITDNRLKIVNQENAGVGAARNKGMSKAKFHWIALLDADDTWSSSHLKEMSKIIQRYPSCGLVSSGFQTINSPLSSVRGSGENSVIRKVDYFTEVINGGGVLSSSVAIHRDVFNSIGGFTNDKMGEDIEYWVRVALHYPVAISEKVTAYYYKGTSGVTENQRYDYYREVSNLEQCTPAMKCIMDYSKENPSVLKNTSIIKYINKSLLSIIKTLLLHNNIPAAKNRAELAIPQRDKMFMQLYFISLAPTAALSAALKIRSIIKN